MRVTQTDAHTFLLPSLCQGWSVQSRRSWSGNMKLSERVLKHTHTHTHAHTHTHIMQEQTDM